MGSSEADRSVDLQTKAVTWEPDGEDAAQSRLDPISGKWTIFAPHRSNRPEEYVPVGETLRKNLQCPFCAGNESETPPAIWVGAVRDGVCHTSNSDLTADNWSVRVVPNRFPAISAPRPSDDAEPHESSRPGLFECRPIHGGHEVIIESREHTSSVSQLDPIEVHLTFLAYRDRIRHWRSQSGASYVSVFKNVGERAGASLRHSHSQLIATDQMPADNATIMDRVSRYRASTGCCLQCDLIRGELKARRRVVWKDKSVIAFCPFAARLPLSLRITTLAHQPHFDLLNDAQIESVFAIGSPRRLPGSSKYDPRPPTTTVFPTCPPGYDSVSEAFHWSLDLFPRMTQLAGFEWNSGCMINPVLPEVAAAKYGDAVRAQDPRSSALDSIKQP